MREHDSFSAETLQKRCDILARKDAWFKNIIKEFGYPPYWSRDANFATLVYIILEQQVSLASAKAAFLKLQSYCKEVVPHKILSLSDEEMKACYFSRQKAKYVRHLATEVINRSLVIEDLHLLPDESVRTELKKIKGIGDWTADIFLMMALHRTDCFPGGDIALLKSIKETRGLPNETPKEELLAIAESWKPNRTIAAFMLWHAYLSRRNKNLVN